MAFDEKAYRRAWMRNKRSEQGKFRRERQLEEKGKCLVCEMLLSSQYHVNCPAIHIHGFDVKEKE